MCVWSVVGEGVWHVKTNRVYEERLYSSPRSTTTRKHTLTAPSPGAQRARRERVRAGEPPVAPASRLPKGREGSPSQTRELFFPRKRGERRGRRRSLSLSLPSHPRERSGGRSGGGGRRRVNAHVPDTQACPPETFPVFVAAWSESVLLPHATLHTVVSPLHRATRITITNSPRARALSPSPRQPRIHRLSRPEHARALRRASPPQHTLSPSPWLPPMTTTP